MNQLRKKWCEGYDSTNTGCGINSEGAQRPPIHHEKSGSSYLSFAVRILRAAADSGVMERLPGVLKAIDAVNANDPVSTAVDGVQIPRALLYGQRMSAVLAMFQPDASEALRIAARAQHIERWIMPRQSYPEGRIAYLKWRKDLQQHHAARTGAIMHELGYSAGGIARVSALLRKERLKYDAEAQALEDVVCLVFLQFEAPDFIALHDDGKVRDILAKTARKMSPRGLEAASKLRLDERLARLLGEALA